MTQAKPRFQSFEDYLNYDDGTDARYELVDGELVELPTESWDAGAISLYLFTQLLPFVPYYLLRHKDTELAVPSLALLNRGMNFGSALTLTLSRRRGNKRVLAPFSCGRRVGDEGKSCKHSATPRV